MTQIIALLEVTLKKANPVRNKHPSQTEQASKITKCISYSMKFYFLCFKVSTCTFTPLFSEPTVMHSFNCRIVSTCVLLVKCQTQFISSTGHRPHIIIKYLADLFSCSITKNLCIQRHYAMKMLPLTIS